MWELDNKKSWEPKNWCHWTVRWRTLENPLDRRASLVAQMVKCQQCRRPGFDPWVGKIPWRRKWQPTAVFLPGKSHGWRSLAVYSPWGYKESDVTERLHFTTFINLHMLNHSCIPGINPTLSWCIILLMYCWIWFANILLNNFALYS